MPCGRYCNDPSDRSRAKGLAKLVALLLACTALVACDAGKPYADVIVRGGTLVDGLGGEPFLADVAIRGDRVAQLGDLSGWVADREIDAHGKIVAPGFINMLSWANNSLLENGRAESDVRQGITLEVMGEGWSWGPLPAENPASFLSLDPDASDEGITWRTLGQFLDTLETRGVSPNVASFVGASTVRMLELGLENRAPSPEQLERMRASVRLAMEEGAMGVGAALVYVPGNYASTEELVALAEVVSEFDGLFIAHMRNEGPELLEAVDEMIDIARQADVRTEIHHLKAAGPYSWHKLDVAIDRIEAARDEGVALSANMYPYRASATRLSSVLPAWARDGGNQAMLSRLADPDLRARLLGELQAPASATSKSVSRLVEIGADNLLLLDLGQPELAEYTGMTLAEAAAARGKEPAEAVLDLLLEADGLISSAYFIMSDDNILTKMALPWASFCTDAEASSGDPAAASSSTHPREYGAFPRVLGEFVRERQVIPLQEAVRRMTSLPALNLRIADRGSLTAGYFADLVIFDPDTVSDNATFADPRQYASGIDYVFVNGELVVSGGEHTGATPGRFVRGPGWQPQ